jgi:hypothetical protein
MLYIHFNQTYSFEATVVIETIINAL